MPLRKLFATAAAAAAIAGVGVMAAPAAQADTVSAATAGPTAWIPWGTYADLASCHHAGQWAVQNAGASNYTCSQTAPNQYALYIYRV